MADSYTELSALIADMAGALTQAGKTPSWIEREQKKAALASMAPALPVRTANEWTKEMVAAIRAKDAIRLQASLAAGADPNYTTHTLTSALSMAVSKKWTEGLSQLLHAGAKLSTPTASGEYSLLWTCASSDFIEGAKLLWDRHSEKEQDASCPRFHSLEGLKLLAEKGCEEKFDAYTLHLIGMDILSKRPLDGPGLDKLERIFRSPALGKNYHGELWIGLIEQDDPQLLDQAGRRGWAPRPDGSCALARFGRASRQREDIHHSFPELIMQASLKNRQRLYSDLMASPAFVRALEADANAMAVLANWHGSDYPGISGLAKHGLDLSRLIGHAGRNPLHVLLANTRANFENGKFVGLPAFAKLLDLCPAWASQKDSEGFAPLGLLAKLNPGKDNEIALAEAAILRAEIKGSRAKKQRQAKRI